MALLKLYNDRLDFDDYWTKNMKIKSEIVNKQYYVKYGNNKRNQISVDIERSSETVDISSLIPKEAKCVFLSRCKSDTMPKLNDNIEVLLLDDVEFTKFPHKFPKNLKELYFSGNKMKKMPDLSYLKNLWSLSTFRDNFISLPNNLPNSIKILTINASKSMKSSLKKLPNSLVILNVHCKNINKIPDLSYLIHLKLLQVLEPKGKNIDINEKTRKMKILIE
jgi:hypothetical protein